MNKIVVTTIIHKNERRFRLQFHPDITINKLVRSIPGARWSKSMKSWHLPFSKTVKNDLLKLIPAGWELIEALDCSKQALEETGLTDVGSLKPETVVSVSTTVLRLPKLTPENQAALNIFTEKLELKGYSESTIRTYTIEFRCLLQLLVTRPASTLSSEDVKRYILYCINDLHLKENTIHSRLNALKFYFEQVLNREKIFVDIPRPKRHLILPKVLGEQEIGALFRALDNKKHKAILFTAYSAGLRVSEVVRLRIKDIDADRMQIFVEKAKGKKDRYVMLSPVLLDLLRNYLRSCKPRPEFYLFEGDTTGEPISSRMAQHIFLEAKFRAGIKKQLSFHSLRHSFATHLLENGVDIKYIKELLGHFDINTTNRYLHVKKEQLVNISSPLDNLYKSGKIDF